ncbi:MAG: ParA family protein [Proteobacteria bacterium]|nr:ParA family protein [Pseudomonadota bacterium]
MQRITVINMKGGCGKTTIATNLASALAVYGRNTTLIDYDPQGSSTYWLKHRAGDVSEINGIVAYPTNQPITRSWQMQIPLGTEYVIVDTPACLKGLDMIDQIDGSNTIVIPVLPSSIDMHATADFIRDLYLLAKVKTKNIRLCIVCNRVRSNTLSFQALENFLDALDIPVIAKLRETQSYNKASECGLGIHEMGSKASEKDHEDWRQIIHWLDVDQQIQ